MKHVDKHRFLAGCIFVAVFIAAFVLLRQDVLGWGAHEYWSVRILLLLALIAAIAVMMVYVVIKAVVVESKKRDEREWRE